MPATAGEDICKDVGIGLGVDVAKSEDLSADSDVMTVLLIESERREVSGICNDPVVEAASVIEVDEAILGPVKFEASVVAVIEVGWDIGLDEGLANPVAVVLL